MYRKCFVVSLCICVCGCTLERPCDETEHFDIETQKCAKTLYTPDHCGYPELNCNDIEGVQEGTCDNGECRILSCKTDYHLTSDGRICEEDTAAACGNPDGRGPKNCVEQEGVEKAECMHGQCVIDNCEDGYYLYESSDFKVCSKYSTLACGQEHVNCMSEGVMKADCVDGKCQISECREGYSRAESDGLQFCNRDTEYSCGSERVICVDPKAGIESAKCINGQCVTDACISGYSLITAADGTTCVQDTPEACGVDRIACSGEFNNAETTRCDDGECHLVSCVTGYSADLENDVCVKEDSPESCGPDEINCYDEHPNATEIFCNDNRCVIARCKDLYLVSNNSCELIPEEARLGTAMYAGGHGDHSTLLVPETPQDINTAQCISIDVSKPSSNDTDITVSAGSTSGYTLVTVNSTRDRCIRLTGTKQSGGFAITTNNNINMDIILDNVKLVNLVLYSQIDNVNVAPAQSFVLRLNGTSTITGPTTNNKSIYYKNIFSKKKIIYSNSHIKIVGPGTLNVNARYKTGIYTEDELFIFGGTINVNLDRKEASKIAGYDDKGFGVKVVNGFNMISGTLNVNANDKIEGFEGRGIKVDGLATDEYYKGKGKIYVYGGSITVNADAKGMTAGWTKQDECEDECEDWDPIQDCIDECMASIDKDLNAPTPDVNIHGGNIHIVTSGTPRPRGSGYENALSPEGLEAKRNLTITDGEIYIQATEDGINAGNLIQIQGGQIYSRSLMNDGIDSNNTISFAYSVFLGGATIMTLGAKGTQGGIDGDDNLNISFNGGHIIAVGGKNNLPNGWGALGSQYISVRPDETINGKTYVITKKGSPYVLMGVSLPEDLGLYESYDDEPNPQTANHLLFIDQQLVNGEWYTLYEMPQFTSTSSAVTWLYDTMLLSYAKVDTNSAMRSCDVLAGVELSECIWK